MSSSVKWVWSVKKQMDVELLEQHLAQSKCEVSEVGWLKGRDTQEPPATNL